jgi:hypothetical protein
LLLKPSHPGRPAFVVAGSGAGRGDDFGTRVITTLVADPVDDLLSDLHRGENLTGARN